MREIWNRIEAKMQVVAPAVGEKIPYTTHDGVYDDYSDRRDWWTNGFYGGMLWMLYEQSGNEMYRKFAEIQEEKLDEPLYSFKGVHHDVGFMWLHTAVKNFTLNGGEKSWSRGMLAAATLSSRYVLKGGFIRAWNHSWGGKDVSGWAIIDCMMNIPLLHWASEQIGDRRFAQIANSHADKVLEQFIRADGSVRHIVEFDPETGEYKDDFGGQGFEKGSSWSRGQAWAVNGFAQSYLLTGEKRYLDAAKRVANYFITNICDDWTPRCDFRQPAQPHIIDTTAGVIAASGFVDIARCVGENEAEVYLRAAENIVRTFVETQCDWTTEQQAILMNGTEAYHNEKTRHIPIIYGDFYLMETVIKLMKLGR